MINRISVFPRATEKAYGQSKNNVYVFNAPTGANKQQIVAAIETQYNVKVTGIKTLVQSGKAIRVSKGKRSQPMTVNRKDAKKAYVTLAEGNSIKVFDEEPTAETVVKTNPLSSGKEKK